MCESAQACSQGNHQARATMQGVNLFHYLSYNAGQQGLMGTQVLLGLVHPGTRRWGEGGLSACPEITKGFHMSVGMCYLSTRILLLKTGRG